ncbi:MAG: PAS domain-containing protein [Phycisphaerae bacterium]|nr:PAS domain-containing protein [Phycisphaerae bacterium]NIU10369.1 PAS domain-containing protein [Phycisphaerae bacterium]NIW10790.1 PAS domain-containing protein [Gammaproteobacteria bacterium]NIX29923.1 PAS domain-containing protein [Phycisphaerae bacterium]
MSTAVKDILNGLKRTFEIQTARRYDLRFFFLAYILLVAGTLAITYHMISSSSHESFSILRVLALSLLLTGLVLIHIFWPRAGKSILSSQEKQHKEILDSMPDAMIVVDSQGKIQDWNVGAANLFGYGRHEILGTSIFNLFANSNPEHQNHPLMALNGGRVENLEVECIGKNEKRTHVLFRQVPIGDNSEAAQRFILFGRDITQYKRIQEQAMQTEKLAATGRFAADIAHQLNTPLGSILLSAQMLQDGRLSADEREDVEKIIRQVNHSKFVVKSLLDFSRNASGNSEVVDLNKLVSNTVDLFRQSLCKRNIRIECSYEPRACKSRVYANELEQVVLNLLTNAADAMPKGGAISVRTSLYLDRDFIIYFEDSGTGISKENLNKIFEPFFTTKEVGSGTGLGLPVCKRIIEHHNGSIAVSSRENTGTLAVVKIPMDRGGGKT